MTRIVRFFVSRKSWVLPYLIFSVIFVIVPLLLIVVYAFTDDAGRLTLENFRKFFDHPEAVNTFVYSIGIAMITTVMHRAGLSGSVDIEQLQEAGVRPYIDYAVHSSDVGEHSGAYTCHGSFV